MPKISVIMPVYNAEQYLWGAIESILNQTFKDFEFIIINDGSTDKSADIIESYSDQRIKVITQQNAGIVSALNNGINNSSGQYIARMDSDDVSLPLRFEKQVEFLDNNPDYGLIGTTFLIIDEKNHAKSVSPVFLKNDDIVNELIFFSPFGHGTVLMRRSILNEVGLYSSTEQTKHIEDYALWVRISAKTKVANLPEVLYLWRENTAGISSLHNTVQMRNMYSLRKSLLIRLKNIRTQKFIDIKRKNQYRDEYFTYQKKNLVIRRKNRLAQLYMYISFNAFWQHQPALSIRSLVTSFLLSPLIIIKTILRK